MAEYSGPATLTTATKTINFNGSNVGQHDPMACSGLERLGQIRSVTEDRPRTDGGIAFPRKKSARQIALGGWINTPDTGTRNAWINDLCTALEEILDGGGTYVWQEQKAGGGVDTCTLSDVWCDIPPGPGGAWFKRYQFGLVCPNPTIAVT